MRGGVWWLKPLNVLRTWIWQVIHGQRSVTPHFHIGLECSVLYSGGQLYAGVTFFEELFYVGFFSCSCHLSLIRGESFEIEQSVAEIRRVEREHSDIRVCHPVYSLRRIYARQRVCKVW
jgi:hypothetical protein